MPNDNLNSLTVGSSNTYYDPWPNQWPTPLWQPGNTYVYGAVQPPHDYANEVEVDRGEHDATLRFYRRRGNSRALVKEVSVPLALLDRLAE